MRCPFVAESAWSDFLSEFFDILPYGISWVFVRLINFSTPMLSMNVANANEIIETPVIIQVISCETKQSSNSIRSTPKSCNQVDDIYSRNKMSIVCTSELASNR